MWSPLLLAVCLLPSEKNVAFQTPTLTLTTKFLTVGETVKMLAAQSQLPLEVEGEVGEYPLYLRVKDQPLKLVMDKVAEAVGAEWVQKGSVTVLACSAALRARQDRMVDPEEVSAIQKDIDRNLEGLKLLRPYTEDDAKAEREVLLESQRAMDEMTKQPGGPGNPMNFPRERPKFDPKAIRPDYARRASLSAVQGLGASRIAMVLPNDQVVYSTNPGPGQTLLPRSATLWVPEFVQANQFRRQHLAGIRSFSGANPNLVTGNPNLPRTALVVLTRGEDREVRVSLSVVDSNGDLLGAVSSSVGRSFYSVDESDLKSERFELSGMPAAVFEQMTLAYQNQNTSSLTLTLSEKFAMSRADLAFPGDSPSPLILEYLKRMQKEEPWSLVYGPVFDKIRPTENIVACLPDELFMNLPGRQNIKSLSEDGFFKALILNKSIRFESNQGWTSVRARRPRDLRESWLPRPLLRRLTAAVLARKTLKWEDLLTFAGDNEKLASLPFVGVHVSLAEGARPTRYRMGFTVRDYPALRMLGLIRKGGNERVLQGEPTQLGLLPKAVGSELEKWFNRGIVSLQQKNLDNFSTFSPNQSNLSSKIVGNNGRIYDIPSFRPTSFGSNLGPIVLLKNGLPSNASVVVDLGFADSVFVREVSAERQRQFPPYPSNSDIPEPIRQCFSPAALESMGGGTHVLGSVLLYFGGSYGMNLDFTLPLLDLSKTVKYGQLSKMQLQFMENQCRNQVQMRERMEKMRRGSGGQ